MEKRGVSRTEMLSSNLNTNGELTCWNDVELTGVPLSPDLVVGKAGHGSVVPLRDGREG
jgi:hypothetical protein